MIVKEKNTVEANPIDFSTIKIIGEKSLYNIAFDFQITSPDNEIEFHQTIKSFILSKNIDVYNLFDIISGADEKDLQQIIELLMYYLEQAHFFSKFKM